MLESIHKKTPSRQEVIEALRYLATKSEWYLTDLPSGIGNAHTLRELDHADGEGHRGYIEYAWSSVWCSPYRQEPISCSGWDRIIERKDEPRYQRQRIRLTERGRREGENLSHAFEQPYQTANGQGGECPSIYVENLVMGDQNTLMNSTAVIRSTVVDSAKIVRDDHSKNRANEPHGALSWLHEHYLAPLIVGIITAGLIAWLSLSK